MWSLPVRPVAGSENGPPDNVFWVVLEIPSRESRRREACRRLRGGFFAYSVKSFDTFDFAAIPSLNKLLVLELAR